MKKINPENIKDNPITLIGKEWLLITAGDKNNFNSMTASWGAMGFMWNRAIAIAMIRPQRYTFSFAEKNDICTLSFYDEKYKPQLSMFGSKSGRDFDKVKLSNFTPAFTENGAVYYDEAKLVLECKKLYSTPLDEKSFLDEEIVKTWYPNNDFHKMYYFEIMNTYIKE